MSKKYKKNKPQPRKVVPLTERLHGVTLVSPRTKNEKIEKLLDRLDTGYDAVQVPVRVEAYAKKGNCFINVQDKVARDGGQIQYGWVVWQSRHLLEAEHHSVWQNDNGDLIDITPREKIYTSVMFIPDDCAAYNGNAIPNVRINVTGNQIVADMIALFDTRDAIYNLGIRLNDDELLLPTEVSEIAHQLEFLAGGTEMFYLDGGSFEKECFCQSGRLYRDCHHNSIADLPNLIASATRIAEIENSHLPGDIGENNR